MTADERSSDDIVVLTARRRELLNGRRWAGRTPEPRVTPPRSVM